MEHNVYAPPEALVLDASEIAGTSTEYYVVSRTKLVVLYIATFGYYQLYWFYKHWANWRAGRRVEIWPVMRAIFPIFFVYSLAEEIDQSRRRAGATRRFAAVPLAAGFILLTLAQWAGDRILPRFFDLWSSIALGLGLWLALGAILVQVQVAANEACGDPTGASNARFTWANWLWIAVSGIGWAYVALFFAALAGHGPLVPLLQG
jgi:hypothetical protein